MGATTGLGLVRDGLIFGYDSFKDTGEEHFDNNRYYKGRPSINYIAHQNALPQSSYETYVHTAGTWADNHPFAIKAYNAQGTQITGYVNTGVNSGNYTPWQHAHWQYDNTLKKPVVVTIAKDTQWKAKNFGAQMGAWATDYGLAAGDKYVISWLQWTSDLNLCADVGFYSKNTSNSNGFHDGRSGGSAKNTKLNTWERVHHVYTISANRNLTNSYGSVYMYTHTQSNIDGVIKIADVQLEIDTDWPSAYIPQASNEITGSRSSTESLRNVVNNVGIDISNVSFNDKGHIEFDGTNDYLLTGILSGRNPATNPFTVEAIVKADSANGMMWVDVDGNGSNQRFYSSLNTSTRSNFGIQGSAWSSGTPIDTNWHYQAIVMDGSTARAYDNGVQVHTKSYTSYTIANNLRVGSRSGTSYVWDGQIPVFRVYDRALTPEEITQNYNSYKTRFNI